jgi:hypothetical protein
MRQELFYLLDGTPVFKGEILYHPDPVKVGWYCKAEFEVRESGYVTVRSPNGAVPTVRIADLRKEPPQAKRCSKCCQLLPEKAK